MKVLLRLVWRGLVRHPRFSLLFLVNLALGLTGFLLVSSFSATLSRYVDGHLREILTADVVIQGSRPLTEQERERVRRVSGPDSRFSRQIAFYTMVKGGGTSKLAQIVAIDAAYPLYGAFQDAGQPVDPHLLAALQEQPRLLMSRETARSYGLRPDDPLTIGQLVSTARTFFDRDPGGGFTGLTLAPKIYLGLPQVESSNLIRFGSRVTHTCFIRLPETADNAEVATRLGAALAGPEGKSDLRVSSTVDVNRRLGRAVGYFSSFLGLASMASLGLAGLAGGYLFREHLRGRRREIAILLSLGAGRRQCLLLPMGELALLGLGAASLATMLSQALLPLFSRLFVGLIPVDLPLGVDPASVLMTLVIGTAGSLLFCLPVYRRILAVRPLSLLRDQFDNGSPSWQERILQLATLVPAVGLLFFLAVRLSHTPAQGIGFAVGLAAVIGLLALIGRMLAAGCRRWSRTDRLTWRIVWRNLYRNRLAASAVFAALATALLLVNLIPQVEKGLIAEIGQPEGMERPDLFLIDIQEEQRQPLEALLHTEQVVLSPLAPMVQGRIASINGIPFARWRDQHGAGDERGLRRTEFNFSSRTRLDPSEHVVEGVPLPTIPWAMDAGEPFALSMEREFSERLRVGIGDRMVIDILGIELEGRIVNLRKVSWNSFQPNFFMLVQPGVLDEAPKTYLASVSGVENKDKQALVNRLTAAFANISVIDVSGTVERLSALTAQLSQSLRFMAGIALATGLVTVVAIARQEALRREREINLLRVLGAGIGRIRTLMMLEFALLGGAAALIALLLSLCCSLGISWLMFDRLWQFQWLSAILLLLSAPLICSFIALLAADSVIRRPPTTLLG